jgi:tetratricopeptide (TPR) repeat protein
MRHFDVFVELSICILIVLIRYGQRVALECLKKFEEAVKTLTYAIELQPKYVEIYHTMSEAFKALNKIDEATIYKNKAIELETIIKNH